MRLVTFTHGSSAEARVGYLDGDDVVPVEFESDMRSDMIGLIRQGLDKIAGPRAGRSSRRYLKSEVKLLAPIPKPTKNIICVGKNYRAHANEFHSSGFDASAGKDAVPDVPIIFTKPYTTVIGPGEAIQSALDPTASVDYENELAVIIGKRGRGIKKADAYSHVFGYTIVNDVTARQLQHRHKQWFLGKGLDTFCPMGPCILTADEVPDPKALRLTTLVNGELRQDAHVKDLIFDIPTLIETISSGMTLEPGDIIATGTPEGVGIGFKPPRYLRPNDTISLTIEPIGTLQNKVV